MQGVKPPATADGVAGFGHTDAFVKGARARERGKAEVAHYSAVSNVIIKNKRVSAVLVIAARSVIRQRSEEGIKCGHGREGVAVLVENPERAIDRFYVMIRTDISNCGRR